MFSYQFNNTLQVTPAGSADAAAAGSIQNPSRVEVEDENLVFELIEQVINEVINQLKDITYLVI